MSTAKPDIVTPEQWRAAREALLEREKARHRSRRRHRVKAPPACR